MLEATLPVTQGATYRYTDNIGHYLLKEVSVEIGGQQIDKHYADWLEIWYQLTIPAGQRAGYLQMIGQSPKDSIGQPTGLQTVAANTAVESDRKIFVPLQFWFCRNIGLALPLIALQYHEVKINVLFETVANLGMVYNDSANTHSSSGSLSDVALWVDYVYLDTDERRRFAQVSHEYLIEQLQFTGNESVSNGMAVSVPVNINLNHPVKELVWVCRRGDAETRNQWNNYTDTLADPSVKPITNLIPAVSGTDTAANALDAITFTYGGSNTASISVTGGGVANAATGSTAVTIASLTSAHDFTKPSGCHNPVVSGKLQLNGQDRFATRTGNYFNLVQPKCHSNVPRSPGINVYSFALKPEDHQPSGTCNFSRIDNAKLQLSVTLGADGIVKVFAVNYNVLRIMSGMGGLAYSN